MQTIPVRNTPLDDYQSFEYIDLASLPDQSLPPFPHLPESRETGETQNPDSSTETIHPPIAKSSDREKDSSKARSKLGPFWFVPERGLAPGKWGHESLRRQ
jgi:hypothetical protein